MEIGYRELFTEGVSVDISAVPTSSESAETRLFTRSITEQWQGNLIPEDSTRTLLSCTFIVAEEVNIVALFNHNIPDGASVTVELIDGSNITYTTEEVVDLPRPTGSKQPRNTIIQVEKRKYSRVNILIQSASESFTPKIGRATAWVSWSSPGKNILASSLVVSHQDPRQLTVSSAGAANANLSTGRALTVLEYSSLPLTDDEIFGTVNAVGISEVFRYVGVTRPVLLLAITPIDSQRKDFKAAQQLSVYGRFSAPPGYRPSLTLDSDNKHRYFSSLRFIEET